jgi:isopenicillin-N epimerase
VRRDLQADIRPLVISHAATSKRTERSRFLQEFDWTGTGDPTAWLCVPAAIDFLGGLLPGGWPALRAHNRALALAARDVLCEALHQPPPVPDDMIGTLVAMPLPASDLLPAENPLASEPLQSVLYAKHAIEVPIWSWPAPPRRHVRIAAQIYNHRGQYEHLAAALREELRGA